jgi:hypothetical protein
MSGRVELDETLIQQIHDSIQSTLRSMGQIHKDSLRAETGLDLLQDALVIGAKAIQLVYKG